MQGRPYRTDREGWAAIFKPHDVNAAPLWWLAAALAVMLVALCAYLVVTAGRAARLEYRLDPQGLTIVWGRPLTIPYDHIREVGRLRRRSGAGSLRGLPARSRRPRAGLAGPAGMNAGLDTGYQMRNHIVTYQPGTGSSETGKGELPRELLPIGPSPTRRAGASSTCCGRAGRSGPATSPPASPT